MKRSDESHQCWYCYRRYAEEDLGRVRVTEPVTSRGWPVYRVICHLCYQAMRDWFADDEGQQAPPLHGF